MNGMKKILLALMCVLSVAACGCRADDMQVYETIETAAYTEAPENRVLNNPSALTSVYYGEAYNEPFSSYTYDFSVYGSNYMITAAPDDIGTGLVLTVEDNQFGFSTFNVTPPAGYMVVLPYSQQYANQVCTIIKSSAEGDASVPDLMKIDFYLSTFEDETLPYTVSRLYSILDNRLVEVEVYDTIGETDSGSEDEVFERMDYIPDNYLYQTEPLKFMSAPVVEADEEGNLTAKVITYSLNPNDMTIRRAYEDTSVDNPLYYGYAAHAVAGDIYKYFIATSLNVSDYDNYVEVPVAGADYSQYFFRVDDPRFSTVDELRAYAEKYFDKKMVDTMFREAPQQYRDIDGGLHTLLGDGGMDSSLGKLTITDWIIDENVITYHTKQEKFDENYILTGYVDGGDFVIELTEEGFIVKEYRYPSL